MASLHIRELKGSKFSCSSPAAAVVCASIDRRSVISPCSGRSIDRHTAHLKDSWRVSSPGQLSQPPTKTRPYNERSRKCTRTLLDQRSRSSLSSRHQTSGVNQQNLIGRGNSSRYLLDDSDGTLFDVFPEPTPVLATHPPDRNDSATILKPSSSNVVKDQVVVLRVSLHCKGCERKIRKHMSKMQGVTSFSVDLATKKVVVTGKVTLLGVLNSVSKLKNAEFWSSPPHSLSL